MGSIDLPIHQRQPLKNSGSIDHLEYIDVTPIIGREYPKAQIKEILTAPNANDQIRDLAITICERGVAFFTAPQQNLSVEEQKNFTILLGELTGRPKDHGLYSHPLFHDPKNIPLADGTTDENIYVINARAEREIFKHMARTPGANAEPKDMGREWHSDSLYEICPSDFSFLRMEETPPTGGDTLWVSGYELYDRMSPPFRAFMETLTANCALTVFEKQSKEGGYEVTSPRGSPLNVGLKFADRQPVIRTHPVTGWKSLCAGFGIHVIRINDVYNYEDQMIRDYVVRLITRNHDCVARMHWKKGAAAIWSNACTLHAATRDLNLDDGNRTGIRSSGIGEKPYLDPASKSRREALGLPLV